MATAAEIREKLLAHGLSGDDIQVALMITHYIMQWDSVAFPGEPALIRICPTLSSNPACVDFRAQYRLDDSYEIFVPELYERLIGNEGHARDPRFSETGDLLEVKTPFSIEEVAFGVAAHEVRHRIQEKKGLRLFKEDSRSTNSRLQRIIYFEAAYFQIARKHLLEQGTSLESIETRLGPLEFDSKVIELFVMNCAKELNTTETMRDIILLQPD